MNLPDIPIIRIIDRMTRSNTCFALYRLPWTDEPILVLQQDAPAETMDSLEQLNGKSGFLLAPFSKPDRHPIVLIRPDRVVRDWSDIGSTLMEFESACSWENLEEAQEASAQELSEKGLQQAYMEAFERFIVPLREQRFQKLVLSRKAEESLPAGFSPLEAFVRACNSYPRMMISLCHTPQTGTWLGSTPEIILSGHQEEWNTVALAGTMPMEGDTMPTEWSTKNQEEQAFVSEYIRRTVKRFGTKLTEKGPYTARAGQLVHLKTDFRFQLKSTDHLGNILQELHPTPAVCGLPKEEACTFIAENEGYDRSYYSGIIGWIDPQGDTTLYVNLRCMHLTGGKAVLYAGGGILPQSTPDTEWEETRHKMNTMHNIL